MQHLLSAYKRNNLVISKGDGCFLYDSEGKRYLDFATGIAVNALGHNNSFLNEALKSQVDKLWHCSNLFRSEVQEKYARRLCEISFADRVFFCSSGLEANETAVKIIRKFHYQRQNIGKEYVLTLNNGFHGRSIAMLSACAANLKLHEGFLPLVKGFKSCQARVEELIESINETTSAVMFELVQSEGGVNIISKAALEKIATLCKRYEALIFIDEVQTGFGRCGEMFGYQAFGLEPDIMTCAKSIGNGFPLAACLMKEEVGQCITPGTHGGTYGGNPLACAVGLAVVEEFERRSVVENVKRHEALFELILKDSKRKFPNLIEDYRICGFFGGIELQNISAAQLVSRAIEMSLLLTAAGNDKVIRILPPLIASKYEFEIFSNKFEEVLRAFSL